MIDQGGLGSTLAQSLALLIKHHSFKETPSMSKSKYRHIGHFYIRVLKGKKAFKLSKHTQSLKLPLDENKNPRIQTIYGVGFLGYIKSTT